MAKREFDRRKDKVIFDPQIGLFFALTNSVIGKLCSVGRLSHLGCLHPAKEPLKGVIVNRSMRTRKV
jgi:hypothetical protein